MVAWCGVEFTSQSEADAHKGCDQCEEALDAALQADSGCSTCGARPGEECSETGADLQPRSLREDEP